MGAALLLLFLRLLPAEDLTLFRLEVGGFDFLVTSDDMTGDPTSGDNGSEGLLGPAGIVGVGAASNAV